MSVLSKCLSPVCRDNFSQVLRLWRRGFPHTSSQDLYLICSTQSSPLKQAHTRCYLLSSPPFLAYFLCFMAGFFWEHVLNLSFAQKFLSLVVCLRYSHEGTSFYWTFLNMRFITYFKHMDFFWKLLSNPTNPSLSKWPEKIPLFALSLSVFKKELLHLFSRRDHAPARTCESHLRTYRGQVSPAMCDLVIRLRSSGLLTSVITNRYSPQTKFWWVFLTCTLAFLSFCFVTSNMR